MFTVLDVQRRYAVSEATVLLWIRNGELKATNVGRAPNKRRARWRISQTALDEFERSRTATPATTPTPRRRRNAASADEVVFYS